MTTTPGTTYISGIIADSGDVADGERGYSWSVFGGDMAIDKTGGVMGGGESA